MSNFNNIKLKPYQVQIANGALSILRDSRKVGINVFTKGGKSYISYYMLEQLVNENKAHNIIVIAPLAIIKNLRDNLWANSEQIKRMVFINNELLSHRVSIEKYIESQGHKPSEFDTILIDECHRVFGENIYSQLISEKKFLDNMQLIAMTATPEDTIRHFNKLDALVGKNNVITYTMEQAIKDGVAKPLDYYTCVLDYSKESKEMLKTLINQEFQSAYVLKLVNQLKFNLDMLNKSMSEVMYEYLSKNLTSFDCSEGVRLFAFFSRIDEIDMFKETIIIAIEKLCDKFENKDIKINYIPYTSKNTKYEDDKALDVIKSKAKCNTIDIIATVDKGTEGIHPDNVAFAMILRGTKSIKELLQMMGRSTNLKGDKFNTTIFDFRGNLDYFTKIGVKTISYGTERLYTRKQRKRLQTIEMFSGDKAFNDNVLATVHECEQLGDAIEIYRKIRHMEVLLDRDNSAVLNIIKANLTEIDNKYHSDINVYLASYDTLHNTLYSDQYSEIQKALVFDYYDDNDKKQLKQFSFLDWRIYIPCASSEEKIRETFELYKELKKQQGRIKRTRSANSDTPIIDILTDKFKNDIALKYLSKQYNSMQCALIQSYEEIDEAIIDYVPTFKASDFGVYDKYLENMCLSALNDLTMLKNTGKTRGINTLSVDCKLYYIERAKLNDKEQVYADTILKYINCNFKGFTGLHKWNVKVEMTKADRMLRIIKAKQENRLDELDVVLNNTICYIANNFDKINEIYREYLYMNNIDTLNKFYKQIVDKTIIYTWVKKALSGDGEAMDNLREYLAHDNIPARYKEALDSSEIIKAFESEITSDSIEIDVQTLACKEYSSNIERIRKALIFNMIDDNELIELAFTKWLRPTVSKYLLMKESLSADNHNIVTMRNYIKQSANDVNIKILETIAQEEFSKKSVELAEGMLDVIRG